MKTIILLSCLSMSVFLSGCSTDDERAIKMERNSGRVNRMSSSGWRAVCHDSSHTNGWAGPLRPEKEWAMRDKLDHKNEFPGHDVTIEH